MPKSKQEKIEDLEHHKQLLHEKKMQKKAKNRHSPPRKAWAEALGVFCAS